MTLNDKNVLVVGTGISGLAATELLLNKKISVTLFDANKELSLDNLFERNPSLRMYRLFLESFQRQI